MSHTPSFSSGLGSRTATPIPKSGKRKGGFSRRSNLSGLVGNSLLGSPSIPQSPFPTHALEETPHGHVVSIPPFSSSPVLVAEILTMAEKMSEISVNIGHNHWASLVYGRRLVVWRFGPKISGQKTFPPRELTLSPSDLAHNAKLVNVFSSGINPSPSCIAVSPAGLIRFWPNVAHESNFMEINADLQGQECCSLIDIQPVGSILTTTTSTVVLIYANNMNSLSCRVLKAPQGILGGIGRRVSSLFWGGINNGAESKLIHVVGQSNLGMEDEKMVFVLTANTLQKWLIVTDEPDKLFYNCDIETLAKEAFAGSMIWTTDPPTNPSWLKVWILDMQMASNGLLILMAGLNQGASNMIHFAIGTLSPRNEAPPVQFRSFCVLRFTRECKGEEYSPNWRFLMHGNQNAYIYNENTIICSSAAVNAEEFDELDFAQNGNDILGAGCCGGSPYFFLASQGLITINPGQESAPDTFNFTANESALGMDRTASRLYESLNMSISKDGLENLTMSESKSDQLKAAFLLFCQNKFNQSISIIEELFPVEVQASPNRGQLNQNRFEFDSSLDKLVLSMSQDLMDDFPASDPRWMESVPHSGSPGFQGLSIGVGSTTSLLILHQLEDKQRAFDIYIEFLKDVGLFQRLTGITIRDIQTFTSLVLCEHAEKIAAAIALRKIHSEHQVLVDKAVKRALINRDVTLNTGLTSQDHFYREISQIEDIVTGLQSIEDEAFISERPREIANMVLEVNNVITTILRDCLETRKRKLPEFNPDPKCGRFLEYLPWTSASRSNEFRRKLLSQFKKTIEKAYDIAEDITMKRAFCSQMVDLADIILDGYRSQIESLPTGERCNAVVQMFERDRHDLIMPLVQRGFYEEAASLAEKYYEFVALIAICEATGDEEKLNSYMDKFADKNFSEFVFSWHVKEGKQSKLLSDTSKKRQTELSHFLRGHSDISWMHDIQVGQYDRASETLSHLAENESDYLDKKKTMLSLAKLSVLASDLDDDEITKRTDLIENQLNIVYTQDELPDHVVEAYGFQRETMRVLTPRELIELYIGEENTNSDPMDFKKALDLLQQLPSNDENDENDLMKLHIFARAVLKDNWTKMDVDNPLSSLQETVFFKLAEFCYLEGISIEKLFPDVDVLLNCEEIKQVYPNNKNFQYLIRSGYEHVKRMIDKAAMEV